MNILFQRIINGYLGRKQDYPINESEYNLLPIIFRVGQDNNLDLSQNYTGVPLLIRPLARARNLTIADRMRRYASHRVIK